MEALPYRNRVATSTSMPISQRDNTSTQSNEDNSFDIESLMDNGEVFWQDELSEETLDVEFNNIIDTEVYFYMGSQRPAIPCRVNNDNQMGRDIWAEMEQNERMANIVAALDDIGLRESDIDNNDDGDVVSGLYISSCVDHEDSMTNL